MRSCPRRDSLQSKGEIHMQPGAVLRNSGAVCKAGYPLHTRLCHTNRNYEGAGNGAYNGYAYPRRASWGKGLCRQIRFYVSRCKIYRLRQKVEQGGGSQLIVTENGGYRLNI